MEERFVIFDLETTGLFPQRGDRVIEIGAVSIEKGRVQEEFHSLINSGRPVSKSAQKIHGISRSMLTNEPTPEQAMLSFKSFISDSTLIAHNAKFDIKFIRYEFSRIGLHLTNKYLCTLQISRNAYPDLPNHKLETVYRHLTGDLAESRRVHRALDDARLVAKIWLKMENYNNL